MDLIPYMRKQMAGTFIYPRTLLTATSEMGVSYRFIPQWENTFFLLMWWTSAVTMLIIMTFLKGTLFNLLVF